jgi:N-formylglutamate amidohydrolase
MRLPFVFSLPHNSDRIPDSIRPSIALSPQEIWESIDAGTEEVFGDLSALAVVRARWSRLVVDLNRSTHERGRKGVIPHVDYRGRRVYRDGMAPRPEEVNQRILQYYHPYHAELEKALSQRGIQGMFDCHSLWEIGPTEAPDPGSVRPDIILGNNGDRSGELIPERGTVTCPRDTLYMMKGIFESQGFSVSLNHPYAGGFVTTHYGKRLNAAHRFAVQIEINQGLYIAPGEQELLAHGIEQTKTNIFQALEQIAGNL